MSYLVAQHLKVGTFAKYLVMPRQRKAATKKMLLISLSLTSMVDMFSLLVIFLLQVFSSSPEVLIAQGVQLPSATSGAQMQDAPVVVIAHNEVFLDQKSVGKIPVVLGEPGLILEPLGKMRESWATNHPDKDFQGNIILQADKETASSVISQLMAHFPSQHYSNIHLAVIPGSGALP